eukprot:CAMPEP_0202692436 /NCGR_PEP_ID=MMETSP1385-20130828/6813_1 /ASSEMBLY_ACC=CAM_ASM_000861 /TAXON_ID=933848 /ORGANISM="Elphidium margaritaceum" /LENGTH=454 /DNA_ID=CAMNT_0049347965 /DNA_START=56 /DNA_END=1421 /DNA_ORIENTATION=+
MNQSSKLTFSSNKRNISNQQRDGDRPILTNDVSDNRMRHDSTLMNDTSSVSPLHLNLPFHVDDDVDDDEDMYAIFADYGYTLVRKLRDTLQGGLYEAIRVEDGKTVSIKVVSRDLHVSQTARPDHDGTQFVVTKNILLESITLYHLKLLNNSLCQQFVANYISFFETSRSYNDRYFLVTEYAGDLSLRTFIAQCHTLISEQRLELNAYRKIVKYMYWQLAALVYWMHQQGACHLNLHADNIMVQNAQFTELDNGEVKLDSHIEVKLLDFGMAVMFDASTFTTTTTTDNDDNDDNDGSCDDEKQAEENIAANPFLCDKFGFTENEVYVSPQQLHDEIYDARKVDTWALGLILFQLLTNRNPYIMPNKHRDAGYAALNVAHHDLIRYRNFLNVNGFGRYLSHSAFTAIVGLLNIDESQRWTADQIIESQFLAPYFRRYQKTIAGLAAITAIRNALN